MRRLLAELRVVDPQVLLVSEHQDGGKRDGKKDLTIHGGFLIRVRDRTHPDRPTGGNEEPGESPSSRRGGPRGDERRRLQSGNRTARNGNFVRASARLPTGS